MIATLIRRYGRNSQDLPRILLLALSLALTVLLAVNLARLTWQLLPVAELPSLPAPTQPATTNTTTDDANTTQNSWRIGRWHLFGNAEQQPHPAPRVAQPLPETRLNLTLRGIVSSSDAHSGGAIIASGNGQEVYYSVGSTLPGGATLQSIFKDHVVLERNGRLEKLKLPRDIVGQTTSTTRPRRPANRLTAPGTGSLAGLRQQILSNPQQLLNVFSVEPYTNRGQFIGYRLRPGRDQSLFNRTGLRNGDIVTSINGIRLDTPAKAMTALRGLAQASEARLQIRRNGQPQSLRIDLGQ